MMKATGKRITTMMLCDSKVKEIALGTPVLIPVSFGFLMSDGKSRRKTTGSVIAVFAGYDKTNKENCQVEYLGEMFTISIGQIIP